MCVHLYNSDCDLLALPLYSNFADPLLASSVYPSLGIVTIDLLTLCGEFRNSPIQVYATYMHEISPSFHFHRLHVDFVFRLYYMS